jgi:hypothetical protein
MAAYGNAMRHFLALCLCVGLACLAMASLVYWANAVIASAMLTKPPSPPSAAAIAATDCHLHQSAIAVFAPLVLAWLILALTMREEVCWMRGLRAAMEMVLIVVAVYFVYAAQPWPNPLISLFIERCGPARFLMK